MEKVIPLVLITVAICIMIILGMYFIARMRINDKRKKTKDKVRTIAIKSYPWVKYTDGVLFNDPDPPEGLEIRDLEISKGFFDHESPRVLTTEDYFSEAYKRNLDRRPHDFLPLMYERFLEEKKELDNLVEESKEDK